MERLQVQTTQQESHQHDLDEGMRKLMEQHKEESEKMKVHYEGLLQENTKKNKQAIGDKERKWTEEKLHLQTQLEFTQKQVEENRKMHKQLMSALQAK